MDRAEVIAWAETWIAHWNARDLDAMLAHYRDDVRFESPIAEQVLGAGLVEGKAALRRYWTLALALVSWRRFTLERVVWDPERQEAGIVYAAERDGQRIRCCELIAFDASGHIIRGEACIGPRLPC